MKKIIIEHEPLCPLCKKNMKEWVGGFWCRNYECGAYIEKYFTVDAVATLRTACVEIAKKALEAIAKCNDDALNDDERNYL